MFQTSLTRQLACWIGAAIVQPALAVGPPIAMFADGGAPSAATATEWDGSGWSAPAASAPGSASITWLTLAAQRTGDKLAATWVTSDKRAYVAEHRGGVWSSPVSLTTGCGTSGMQLAASAYEGASGRLMTVYRKASDKKVYYRVFSVANPAEQTFSMSLNGAPRWIGLASRAGSNELLMVVRTSSRIYAAVWNGVSWGNQVTLETSTSSSGRPAQLAYTAAGTGIVIWGSKSGTPEVRTWNGSWGSTGTLPGPSTPAAWMMLAPSPASGSNEMLAAWTNTSNDISVARWNGSAWSSGPTVETNCSSAAEARVDLAWEPGGAGAILAWHRTGETFARYRRWGGGIWDAEQRGEDIGTEVGAMRLVPGTASNEVLALVRRKAAAAVTDYTVYTSGGSLSLSGVTVTGATGAGVSGVSLPSAPAGTGNTSDLTYGNNASASISPGTYGVLTTGNNATITLSPGTYIFKTVSLGNGATITANTAGGDVQVIVSTGGWSAGNNLTIAPADPDDPGDLTLSITGGSFSAGNNASIDAGRICVHAGSFSAGSNADFTTMVWASGSVSIASGTVSGSDVQTPAGALVYQTWLGGSVGSSGSVCSTIAGSGLTFDAAPTGSSGVRVINWKEIGIGE